MKGSGEPFPLGREELESLVHRISNLLSAIYAFGEPAQATGEGMKEALGEILSAGARLEDILEELKRLLREGEEGKE